MKHSPAHPLRCQIESQENKQHLGERRHNDALPGRHVSAEKSGTRIPALAIAPTNPFAPQHGRRTLTESTNKASLRESLPILVKQVRIMVVHVHSSLAHVHFLVVQVHFLVAQVHFMVAQVHFMVAQVHFMVVQVHFPLARLTAGFESKHLE